MACYSRFLGDSGRYDCHNFLNIPALSLGMSALFILFSSGVILVQTSDIIRGGERNYILATVTLYVSIYNIFISLLNLLMAFAGNDD